MRLLLAQHMPYRPDLPDLDGPGRAVSGFRAALAAHGHDCRVVAPEPAEDEPLHRRAYRLATEFDPHWIIVVAGDPDPLALATALRASPGRVAYLAHAPRQLPFGPLAVRPSAPVARLLESVAGIVAVSEATRDYVRDWGGFDAELIHPPAYSPGPWPRADLTSDADPTGRAVTALDPAGCHGQAIMRGLAEARPDLTFHAATRNPSVDTLLSGARTLLMPSLWEEGFGYLAVDAMLRGVPVIASDIGGLTEAMLGVPHLVPVRPIRRYAPGGDGGVEPVVPGQDLGPWLCALAMLDDPSYAAEVAARGAAAAAAFVAGIGIGRLAEYLENLETGADRDVTAEQCLSERRAALARIIAWAGR